MKINIYFTAIFAGIFFSSITMGQEAAKLTFESGEYELNIPYFEFNGNAFSVALNTPDDSNDLFFLVDFSSLSEVEVKDDEDSDLSLDISNGICTATSNAAFLSCQSEVEEENFIAIGNCFNESNSLNAIICESQALAAMEESGEECEEQWEARLQVCAAVGEGPYDPFMDAGNFMTLEQIVADPNPWLPLVPGNQWVYESEEETVTVIVTEETRAILGITSIVVRDVVTEDGELVEDTDDWFAQDLDGNVWYMGEISRNYEDGRLVDLEGSWEAGVDGAKAGILIRANPVIGETLRQEFLLGEAEDMGETITLTGDESSGDEAGVDCQQSCLGVYEYTPIEPDAQEEKYYYPGIGKIVSIDLETGEREELVEYTVQ